MIQEILCVARNPIQARELIKRIESMGIPPRNVAIATRPSEVEHAVYPDSQVLHDAKLGFIFGGLVGWLLSTAVLVMIGTPTMRIAEALPLLIGGVIGGAILGAVFAASGILGAAVMASSLERHYEEEVGRGGILISVEFRNKAEQKAVKSAMHDSGASDVYESVEIAA
jgi:hypothetical protein